MKATEPLKTRRPSLQDLYNLSERIDALARALEILTLPENAEHATRTGASIAAHLSDTGRALASITAGWRLHLPDLHAQSAARRLSTELCRSLMQLDAIERRKENPDETKS